MGCPGLCLIFCPNPFSLGSGRLIDSLPLSHRCRGLTFYRQGFVLLRGRLAVESLYAPGYGYVVDTYGSFAAWADDFVPRFKNESGLVLYFQVDSVDQGEEIWQQWQAAHRK